MLEESLIPGDRRDRGRGGRGSGKRPAFPRTLLRWEAQKFRGSWGGRHVPTSLNLPWGRSPLHPAQALPSLLSPLAPSRGLGGSPA